MNNNSQKIKYGIIIGLVVMLGTIGFYTFQTISRQGKVRVTVSTIPSDAKVIIDNNTVNNGDNYVKPGQSKVVVEKPGFTTYSADNVTFSGSSGAIDIALTAESADAQTWSSNHQAEYLAYEGRAGDRAIAEGAKDNSINPVIKYLPFKNLLFNIGYFADQTDSSGKSIIVTIDAPEGYRQAAINKISEWGVNPAGLNIIFKSYENPFSL